MNLLHRWIRADLNGSFVQWTCLRNTRTIQQIGTDRAREREVDKTSRIKNDRYEPSDKQRFTYLIINKKFIISIQNEFNTKILNNNN